MLDIIKPIVKAGVPLLLEGPTGTGKTYMIMELAKAQKKTLHVINVSGELTVDSILGEKTLIDGNIKFFDGVVTRAMREGDWILMDELNTALPEVLTVVNGILDDSRSVTLPNAENERVTAHKDFRFIATQNPASGRYAGTGRLNDALLNRMVRVEVGYMQPYKEQEALKRHSDVKDSTAIQLVELAWWTRRNMDLHLSTRDLVKILRLRDGGGLSLKDAISTVCKSKYSDSEYRQIQHEHENILRKLEEFNGYGNAHEDPFEKLQERSEELRKAQIELNEQKASLRDAVRKELLNDLLMGGDDSTTSVPKEF